MDKKLTPYQSGLKRIEPKLGIPDSENTINAIGVVNYNLERFFGRLDERERYKRKLQFKADRKSVTEARTSTVRYNTLLSTVQRLDNTLDIVADNQLQSPHFDLTSLNIDDLSFSKDTVLRQKVGDATITDKGTVFTIGKDGKPVVTTLDPNDIVATKDSITDTIREEFATAIVNVKGEKGTGKKGINVGVQLPAENKSHDELAQLIIDQVIEHLKVTDEFQGNEKWRTENIEKFKKEQIPEILAGQVRVIDEMGKGSSSIMNYLERQEKKREAEERKKVAQEKKEKAKKETSEKELVRKGTTKSKEVERPTFFNIGDWLSGQYHNEKIDEVSNEVQDVFTVKDVPTDKKPEKDLITESTPDEVKRKKTPKVTADCPCPPPECLLNICGVIGMLLARMDEKPVPETQDIKIIQETKEPTPALLPAPPEMLALPVPESKQSLLTGTETKAVAKPSITYDDISTTTQLNDLKIEKKSGVSKVEPVISSKPDVPKVEPVSDLKTEALRQQAEYLKKEAEKQAVEDAKVREEAERKREETKARVEKEKAENPYKDAKTAKESIEKTRKEDAEKRLDILDVATGKAREVVPEAKHFKEAEKIDLSKVPSEVLADDVSKSGEVIGKVKIPSRRLEFAKTTWMNPFIEQAKGNEVKEGDVKEAISAKGRYHSQLISKIDSSIVSSGQVTRVLEPFFLETGGALPKDVPNIPEGTVKETILVAGEGDKEELVIADGGKVEKNLVTNISEETSETVIERGLAVVNPAERPVWYVDTLQKESKELAIVDKREKSLVEKEKQEEIEKRQEERESKAEDSVLDKVRKRLKEVEQHQLIQDETIDEVQNVFTIKSLDKPPKEEEELEGVPTKGKEKGKKSTPAVGKNPCPCPPPDCFMNICNLIGMMFARMDEPPLPVPKTIEETQVERQPQVIAIEHKPVEQPVAQLEYKPVVSQIENKTETTNITPVSPVTPQAIPTTPNPTIAKVDEIKALPEEKKLTLQEQAIELASQENSDPPVNTGIVKSLQDAVKVSGQDISDKKISKLEKIRFRWEKPTEGDLQSSVIARNMYNNAILSMIGDVGSARPYLLAKGSPNVTGGPPPGIYEDKTTVFKEFSASFSDIPSIAKVFGKGGVLGGVNGVIAEKGKEAVIPWNKNSPDRKALIDGIVNDMLNKILSDNRIISAINNPRAKLDPVEIEKDLRDLIDKQENFSGKAEVIDEMGKKVDVVFDEFKEFREDREEELKQQHLEKQKEERAKSTAKPSIPENEQIDRDREADKLDEYGERIEEGINASQDLFTMRDVESPTDTKDKTTVVEKHITTVDAEGNETTTKTTEKKTTSVEGKPAKKKSRGSKSKLDDARIGDRRPGQVGWAQGNRRAAQTKRKRKLYYAKTGGGVPSGFIEQDGEVRQAFEVQGEVYRPYEDETGQRSEVHVGEAGKELVVPMSYEGLLDDIRNVYSESQNNVTVGNPTIPRGSESFVGDEQDTDVKMIRKEMTDTTYKGDILGTEKSKMLRREFPVKGTRQKIRIKDTVTASEFRLKQIDDTKQSLEDSMLELFSMREDDNQDQKIDDTREGVIQSMIDLDEITNKLNELLSRPECKPSASVTRLDDTREGVIQNMITSEIILEKVSDIQEGTVIHTIEILDGQKNIIKTIDSLGDFDELQGEFFDTSFATLYEEHAEGFGFVKSLGDDLEENFKWLEKRIETLRPDKSEPTSTTDVKIDGESLKAIAEAAKVFGGFFFPIDRAVQNIRIMAKEVDNLTSLATVKSLQSVIDAVKVLGSVRNTVYGVAFAIENIRLLSMEVKRMEKLATIDSLKNVTDAVEAVGGIVGFYKTKTAIWSLRALADEVSTLKKLETVGDLKNIAFAVDALGGITGMWKTKTALWSLQELADEVRMIKRLHGIEDLTKVSQAVDTLGGISGLYKTKTALWSMRALADEITTIQKIKGIEDLTAVTSAVNAIGGISGMWKTTFAIESLDMLSQKVEEMDKLQAINSLENITEAVRKIGGPVGYLRSLLAIESIDELTTRIPQLTKLSKIGSLEPVTDFIKRVGSFWGMVAGEKRRKMVSGYIDELGDKDRIAKIRKLQKIGSMENISFFTTMMRSIKPKHVDSLKYFIDSIGSDTRIKAIKELQKIKPLENIIDFASRIARLNPRRIKSSESYIDMLIKRKNDLKELSGGRSYENIVFFTRQLTKLKEKRLESTTNYIDELTKRTAKIKEFTEIRTLNNITEMTRQFSKLTEEKKEIVISYIKDLTDGRRKIPEKLKALGGIKPLDNVTDFVRKMTGFWITAMGDKGKEQVMSYIDDLSARKPILDTLSQIKAFQIPDLDKLDVNVKTPQIDTRLNELKMGIGYTHGMSIGTGKDLENLSTEMAFTKTIDNPITSLNQQLPRFFTGATIAPTAEGIPGIIGDENQREHIVPGTDIFMDEFSTRVVEAINVGKVGVTLGRILEEQQDISYKQRQRDIEFDFIKQEIIGMRREVSEIDGQMDRMGGSSGSASSASASSGKETKAKAPKGMGIGGVIGSLIGGGIKSVIGPMLVPIATTVAAGIKGMATSVLGTLGKGLKGGLKVIGKGAAAAMKGVWKVIGMLPPPFNFVVGGAAIAGLFFEGYDALGKATGWWEPSGFAPSTLFGKAIDGIVAGWNTLSQWFSDLGASFTEGFAYVKAKATELFAPVMDFIDNPTKHLKKFAVSAVTAVIPESLQKYTGKVLGWLGLDKEDKEDEKPKTEAKPQPPMEAQIPTDQPQVETQREGVQPPRVEGEIHGTNAKPKKPVEVVKPSDTTRTQSTPSEPPRVENASVQGSGTMGEPIKKPVDDVSKKKNEIKDSLMSYATNQYGENKAYMAIYESVAKERVDRLSGWQLDDRRELLDLQKWVPVIARGRYKEKYGQAPKRNEIIEKAATGMREAMSGNFQSEEFGTGGSMKMIQPHSELTSRVPWDVKSGTFTQSHNFVIDKPMTLGTGMVAGDTSMEPKTVIAGEKFLPELVVAYQDKVMVKPLPNVSADEVTVSNLVSSTGQGDSPVDAQMSKMDAVQQLIKQRQQEKMSGVGVDKPTVIGAEFKTKIAEKQQEIDSIKQQSESQQQEHSERVKSTVDAQVQSLMSQSSAIVKDYGIEKAESLTEEEKAENLKKGTAQVMADRESKFGSFKMDIPEPPKIEILPDSVEMPSSDSAPTEAKPVEQKVPTPVDLGGSGSVNTIELLTEIKTTRKSVEGIATEVSSLPKDIPSGQGTVGVEPIVSGQRDIITTVYETSNVVAGQINTMLNKFVPPKQLSEETINTNARDVVNKSLDGYDKEVAATKAADGVRAAEKTVSMQPIIINKQSTVQQGGGQSNVPNTDQNYGTSGTGDSSYAHMIYNLYQYG